VDLHVPSGVYCLHSVESTVNVNLIVYTM